MPDRNFSEGPLPRFESWLVRNLVQLLAGLIFLASAASTLEWQVSQKLNRSEFDRHVIERGVRDSAVFHQLEKLTVSSEKLRLYLCQTHQRDFGCQ